MTLSVRSFVRSSVRNHFSKSAQGWSMLLHRGSKMVKDGQEWSRKVKDGLRWSRMIKGGRDGQGLPNIVKYGQG